MFLLTLLAFLAGLMGVAGAIITGGHVIEGAGGVGTPYLFAGTPGAGTNAVQTLTIGGTPTGGTFKLALANYVTGAITWSATNSTLLSNINTALDALTNGGASAIVATAGTLTAGIGTVTLTFSGPPLSHRPVVLMMVANNSLTGTAPTLAIASTTPGVDPAGGRSIAAGGVVIDTTNKLLYQNTGTDLDPTFTKVGTET